METDTEVTLDLSAAILARVSPAELPLLDAMGEDLVHARPRGDGALGFGEAELSWLAAAVPVAGVVGGILLDVVKSAASDVLKDGARSAIRRLRARRHPAAATGPETPVPPELLERVRAGAYRHAVAIGLDADRAELLADAVQGSLSAEATRA